MQPSIYLSWTRWGGEEEKKGWAEPIQEELAALLETEFSLPYFCWRLLVMNEHIDILLTTAKIINMGL